MTALESLAQRWEAENGRTGAISVSAAVLARAGLSPRPDLDELLAGLLGGVPLRVWNPSISSPSGTAAEVWLSGTTDVLGLLDVEVDLVVAVNTDGSGSADVEMTFPQREGWSLGDAFPALGGSPPFLVLSQACFFLTTVPVGGIGLLPWNGAGVELAPGLTFAGEAVPTAGLLERAAVLFGAAAGPLLLSGPVDLSDFGSPLGGSPLGGSPHSGSPSTILCPRMTLSGQLSEEGRQLSPSLVLGPPGVRLTAGLDELGYPQVSLYLTTTITAGPPTIPAKSITLDAVVALLPGQIVRLNVAPSPPESISFEKLAGLLAGRDLQEGGLIPAPLVEVFDSISLVGLNLSMLPSPFTIQAISAAVGCSAPWPLAAGFEVKDLLLRYTVLLPFGSPSSETVYFTGDLAFPMQTGDPSSPTTEVVFEIEATAGSEGDVAIGAQSETAISLAGIYATVTGDSTPLPKTVPRLVFTKLGLFLAGSGSPAYSLWGGMDVASPPWPILGVPVTAALSFQYSSAPFSCQLTGVLSIAGQVFDATVELTDGSAQMTANWVPITGAPLTLNDLLSALDLGLAPVPAPLNLGLQGATLSYASTTAAGGGTTDELVLAIETSLGKAVLAGASGSPPQAAAIFQLGQSFDLTQLPLIGPQLGGIETVTVGDLAVVVATAGAEAAEFDPLIQRVAPGYPTLPAGQPLGEVTLFATADLGGQAFVLALPLVGGGGASVGGSPPASGTTAPGAAAVLPAIFAPVPLPDVAAGSSAASTTPDGTVWFAIQRSFGPVTVQKIGVRYVSATESLFFEIDATLAFGPITLSLIELGLGASLSNFTPVFSLQGIGVSYSNPPLSIAGALMSIPPPAGSRGMGFAGELIVTTENYALSAIGLYEVLDDGSQSVPSFFVFLDVGADFGGPPAFFVTGLAAGFGYNTALALPTLSQVSQFPFVTALADAAGVGSTAQTSTLLERILQPPPTPPWVSLAAGTLWGAAGITFTSFQLVDSVAMLIVESSSSLVITLLGTSTAQYPQPGQGGGDGQPYAYLQLDLEASLQPAAGIFYIEALMAPSSFLLTPACVVTGGFAYAVWFGSSPHAGDFVLTVGGYASGFDPPSYYPTVSAVGFDWVVDANLDVRGSAYLALTPAVFMVGGALDATYTAGSFSAWFDAYADVIIRWSPFWFEAQIGISIGASYTIDLLFTKLRVTIELGCDLTLWGPPTGGTATVHFWVVSLTFAFGAPNGGGAQPLDWQDLVALLPNNTTQSSTGLPVPTLALQASAGVISTAQYGPTSLPAWVVRPSAFAFSTATPIPATSVTFNDTTVPTQLPTGTTFDVHPLGWSAVTASHAVTIQTWQPPNPPVQLDATGFAVAVVTGNVPAALWGSPPEAPGGEPQLPSGDQQLVLGQVVGLEVGVLPPPPGNTAGPIPMETLAQAPVLPTGTLPFGDGGAALSAPIASDATIDVIAETVEASAARQAIVAGLALLGYAPGSNDSLAALAVDTGCWLTAPPLLS